RPGAEPPAAEPAEPAVPAEPPAAAVALPPMPELEPSAEPRWERGLALEIAPRGERPASLPADVRVVRTLALHVPAGAAPSPSAAPGPFRATGRGRLEVERRDDYVFAFEGRGTFRLEIDGEPVLTATGGRDGAIESEPVRLRKGAREIVATYENPLTGSAVVRLARRPRRHGTEPVP